MSDRDLSAARWKKSSHSNGQANCVEVAANLPGVVAVRDSKNPGGPKLTFSLNDWDAFIAGAKDGEFDPP